jgi:hypothetical protein
MAYAFPVTRGEIWWAEVDERRLVLVLSTTDDDVRAVMIVPPAERLIDGIAGEVRLGADDGLQSAGVVRVAFPSENFIPCNWLVTPSAARHAGARRRPGGRQAHRIEGRPMVLYIASRVGDSFVSTPSASCFTRRKGCLLGTTLSGDISANIEDCFVSFPLMARKVSSIACLSIRTTRFLTPP